MNRSIRIGLIFSVPGSWRAGVSVESAVESRSVISLPTKRSPSRAFDDVLPIRLVHCCPHSILLSLGPLVVIIWLTQAPERDEPCLPRACRRHLHRAGEVPAAYRVSFCGQRANTHRTQRRKRRSGHGRSAGRESYGRQADLSRSPSRRGLTGRRLKLVTDGNAHFDFSAEVIRRCNAARVPWAFESCAGRRYKDKAEWSLFKSVGFAWDYPPISRVLNDTDAVYHLSAQCQWGAPYFTRSTLDI